MGAILDLIVALGLIGILAVVSLALGGGYLLTRVARAIVRGLAARLGSLTGVRPALLETDGVGTDPDLSGCPDRLLVLERQLAARLLAVHAQADVCATNAEELKLKPGREALLSKYGQDLTMLRRRSESMRRVWGLVWKSRVVLLARAHVAQTARRRPVLGRLPDASPERAADAAVAAGRYHAAAQQVRDYLGFVDQRAENFASSLPEFPSDAEGYDDVRDEVELEIGGVRHAYVELREGMDRLADNLTWLGDHCAAIAVMDADATVHLPGAGPADLLGEVERAMTALAALAHTVDPAVADSAVANLAKDITRLEEAGLEAQAEAAAVLEVDRLLRPILP